MDPFFYLNSSIPSYSGKEPLKKTILTTHQKRVLFYIRLLESDHPIPIFSNLNDHSNTENMYFHTNYAFYADPICTGKSYVILSLLSLHRSVERKKLLTIWSNGLGMNVFSKIQNFEIPLSILVTPHTSLAQWDNLFKEETNIKYFIVDSCESIDEINIYEYEVIIVADVIFDKVCLQFQGFSVSRIIFDDLLHLEINYTQNSGFTSFTNNTSDPALFGNLRASFTWFISSEPQACLKKYRKSHLPFAILINQIFSFPYPGLIFRNDDTTLEQSLSMILPEIEFEFKTVYLQQIEELNIQKEIENILSIGQNTQSNEFESILYPQNEQKIYKHLFTIFIQRLHMKIISIDGEVSDFYQNLSQDKIKTINERYQTLTDPVTYEKILHPVLLPCCHQIFDLLSISKCLISDMRCPFCRKETKWEDIIGIKQDNIDFSLDQDIWNVLQNINVNEYNILYIPSLNKDVSISKESRKKIHLFIQELTRRYKCFIFSGKSKSKKVFHDFKKEKGILIIAKPIQANLHLSYVNKVFVIHPREYQCKNETVWFSNYFKNYYTKNITIKSNPNFVNQVPTVQQKVQWIQTNPVSNSDHSTSLMTIFDSNWNNRSMVRLTDHELGNFCIGNQNQLHIQCVTFL
jgi:hypothetical protein